MPVTKQFNRMEPVVIASQVWQNTSSAAFRSAFGRTGVADLRYYNASFCEWGAGPPLLLIPGLAGGYELVAPFARALANHFRVISFQLRGEDDCFALRRKFWLRDLVSDIREFAEWHGLERPLIAGVSFGGLLALEYAASHPNLVAGVAVQGVGARFERGLVQRIASLVLSVYPLPSNSPFVNQFFNLLFGGRQAPSLFEFVTHQCWQTDQSVIAHRLKLVERHDLARRTHRIAAPALVVAGDRDFLVSRRSLDELHASIPGAASEVLDGCGHLAFATHPELVAERFSAFLTAATTAPRASAI
jgi:pimeloyl-ACP methyl ester carboxylesterase